MTELYGECPRCGSVQVQVTGGTEFRVNSKASKGATMCTTCGCGAGQVAMEEAARIRVLHLPATQRVAQCEARLAT